MRDFNTMRDNFVSVPLDEFLTMKSCVDDRAKMIDELEAARDPQGIISLATIVKSVERHLRVPQSMEVDY